MCLSDRIRFPTVIVTGLCLLAFGLRVARLDFQPIWFDEDLAYQRATATLAVSLASMAGSPLYYIFLRGWVELAGASLFALRHFSALWGVLTIPLIYRVTRHLLGKHVGLATTLITVTAPGGITATIMATARITATSKFDANLTRAVMDVTTARPYQVYLPLITK
jgi:4-amino-4-deoxy-L-arabinose transferase-like glycosyltransferase